MTPIGRDFRQRQQNEGAQMQTRMGQNERPLFTRRNPVVTRRNPVVKSQKIEIENAGLAALPAVTAERRLDFVQYRQQGLGPKASLDPDDAIDEPGLIGHRYRRAAVPARARRNMNAARRERLQRRHQRGAWRSKFRAWQIGAQSHENHVPIQPAAPIPREISTGSPFRVK